MEKTVKLVKETRYTQFLAQVDKCVESLPQFLQTDLKPILFQAWDITKDVLGVGDSSDHIEFFAWYTLRTSENEVYRDILLGIFKTIIEGGLA